MRWRILQSATDNQALSSSSRAACCTSQLATTTVFRTQALCFGMPSISRVPSSSGDGDNAANTNGDAAVKQEGCMGQEEPRQAAAKGGAGVIPFLVSDCRQVSPSATPNNNGHKKLVCKNETLTPELGLRVDNLNESACQHGNQDDEESEDESCASNGTCGAVASDIECSGASKKKKKVKEEIESDNESEGEDLDENDIVLSLNYKRYKDIIDLGREKLWGKNRKKDRPTTVELSWEVLAELKGLSRGNLYLGYRGESDVYQATDGDARKSKFLNLEQYFLVCLSVAYSKTLIFAEIRADLGRGKHQYKGSIYYKRKDSLKGNETEVGERQEKSLDSEKKVNSVSRMSYPDSRESDDEESVDDDDDKSENDADGIVLSLWDEQYKKVLDRARDKMWGEDSKDEDSNSLGYRKEIAQEVLNELRATGEHLYRGSKGQNSVHPATEKVAFKSKCLYFVIFRLKNLFLNINSCSRNIS